MPISGSGPISFLDLANEFKSSASNINLAELYRNTSGATVGDPNIPVTAPPFYVPRSQSGIPTAGEISLNNFRNKFSGHYVPNVAGDLFTSAGGGPGYKGIIDLNQLSDPYLFMQVTPADGYFFDPIIAVFWDYYTGDNYANYISTNFTVNAVVDFTTLGYHWWSTISWGGKTLNRADAEVPEGAIVGDAKTGFSTNWSWVVSHRFTGSEVSDFYLYKQTGQGF